MVNYVKSSQLPHAASVNSSSISGDRFLVLTNPSANNAALQTVDIFTFINSVSGNFANTTTPIYSNSISVGNSTVNTYINSTSISVTNISSNAANVNNHISVGNSTINAYIGWNSTDLSIAEFAGNVNNYVEVALWNSNGGSNASSDFAIYDNNGPSGYNYIDIGIVSNTWSNTAWTISNPSDGYVYSGNTNLSVGTQGTNYINFFTSGTLANNERMRITPTGNVGINNTNPQHSLSVNGNTFISNNLTVNGNLTVVGNVTLSGTTTFVNSTVITTNDLNLILANNASTNTLANNAGLIIGTSANLVYNSTATSWQSNVSFIPSTNNLNLGSATQLWNLYGNNGFYTGTVNSTSHTIGSNFVANATGVFVGNTATNTIINATSISVGVISTTNGAFINTSTISIGNSTVNTFSNSTHFFSGNSTSYAFGNSLVDSIVTTTGSVVINATAIVFSGNATNNLGTLSISTNTLFLSNGINIGNSTVNTSTNSTHFFSGNSTSYAFGNSLVDSIVTTTGSVVINATAIVFSGNATNNLGTLSISTNTLFLSNGINIGNSTVNTSTNSTHFFSGNSTVYGFGNSTFDVLVNPTSNLALSPAAIILNSNSTANTVANSLGIYTTGTVNAASHTVGTTFIANTTAITFVPNTFTLGTSNASGHTTYGSAGYTYLPNGLKMMWGAITTANSTANIVSFVAQTGVAFTTNCFSLTVTSNAVASVPAAYNVNATNFTLITNSIIASTVTFMAIGI